MAITLSTAITHSCKSRTYNASIHTRQYAGNNNYNSGDNRNNRNRSLRRSIQQVVWGKYHSNFSYIRWYNRLRRYIHNNNSWRSLFTRNSSEISRSSGNNRYNKNYRNLCYYYLLIYLLAIGLPVRAEDEINNTSNPVAAATGNVTNQAVQFQNNGAPSRQHYGPNISCNGSTMTFSPFYMGNHVKPLDEYMEPQSYTMTENWGFQVNFGKKRR